VLKKITADTGLNVVFLQVDEYKLDVAGVRAILDWCAAQLDQPLPEDRAFVFPIVTGITTQLDAGSSHDVSGGANTHVYVLRGLSLKHDEESLHAQAAATRRHRPEDI
jgi:hypothetical protein